MVETTERNNPEEISIKEIIGKFRSLGNLIIRKWLVIAGFSLFTSALIFAFSYFKKPSYTGLVTFVMEEEQSSNPLGDYAGIASTFGIDLGTGGGAFTGDNLIELIQSRYIIEKTLLMEVELSDRRDLLVNHFIRFNEKEEDIQEEYISELEKKIEVLSKSDKPDKNLIKIIEDSLSVQRKISLFNFKKISRNSFSLFHNKIINRIYLEIIEKNFNVLKLSDKLSIVEVRCFSSDELFSKYFSELALEAVMDFYIDTKTRKARQNLSSLEFRTDSVKNLLQSTELNLARVKDANMRLIKAEGYILESRLTRDVQILNLTYMELIKNLEISKLALSKETPLMQIIDRPILPLEDSNLPLPVVIVIGGLLGFFLGCCLVIFQSLYKSIMN